MVKRLVTIAAATAVLAASQPSSALPPPSPQAAATQTDTRADRLLREVDEIATEVAALRGWPFKIPIKKALVTPADVRTYATRELDTSLPPDALPRVQAFLRLIGLIPPDCDLKATLLSVLESQVAGYYDARTATMNLVDRPGTMPPLVARLMIAHELTHALDDQHADLAALMQPDPGRTEDADFVRSSVIEGSATSLMMQYLLRAQLAGRVRMEELSQFASDEVERSRVLLEAPPYFSTLVASYICGMHFLLKGDARLLMTAPDNRSIGENLLAARRNLPRSSEQILHPAKYWNEADRDEPVVPSDAAAEAWLAQPGWWTVHRDTLGELLSAVLTTPSARRPNLAEMQSPDRWTNAAATGWGGDRFYLQAGGATADEARRDLKPLRGAWITAWDTPVDCEEFVAALPDGSVARGHTVVRLGARAAILLFGFSEDDAKVMRERLERSPVPMTRGGMSWSPFVQ